MITQDERLKALKQLSLLLRVGNEVLVYRTGRCVEGWLLVGAAKWEEEGAKCRPIEERRAQEQPPSKCTKRPGRSVLPQRICYHVDSNSSGLIFWERKRPLKQCHSKRHVPMYYKKTVKDQAAMLTTFGTESPLRWTTQSTYRYSWELLIINAR